jgi:hypothetical protein
LSQKRVSCRFTTLTRHKSSRRSANRW